MQGLRGACHRSREDGLVSTLHVFVDETKARDYIMVAAVVVPGDLGTIRRKLNDHMLPGQRRLHMKAERDARKRALADTIASLPLSATVYSAGRRYRTDLQRRRACLEQLVRDLADQGQVQFTLELDETLLSTDRQQLIEVTRDTGCADQLHYRHERAATEPLLALPDAIAWCYAKGGHWRARISSVIAGTTDVQKCAEPSATVVRPGLGLYFLKLSASGST